MTISTLRWWDEITATNTEVVCFGTLITVTVVQMICCVLICLSFETAVFISRSFDRWDSSLLVRVLVLDLNTTHGTSLAVYLTSCFFKSPHLGNFRPILTILTYGTSPSPTITFIFRSIGLYCQVFLLLWWTVLKISVIYIDQLSYCFRRLGLLIYFSCTGFKRFW